MKRLIETATVILHLLVTAASLCSGSGLEELQQQKAEKQEEIADAEVSITATALSLSALQTELSEKETAIAALTIQVAGLESQITQSTADLDALNAKRLMLMAELAAIEQQIKDLQSQHPNLTALGIDGTKFWAVRPNPLPAFKEPFHVPDGTDNTVWIRRLIPSDLSQVTISAAAKPSLMAPKTPQRTALVAIVDNSSSVMTKARTDYFANAATLTENMSDPLPAHSIAAVYGLDMIQWESEAQFEQAFQIALAAVNKQPTKASDKPYTVFSSAFWGIDPRFAKTLLAATCSGRPGPSGVWAAQALTHIDDPVTGDDSYVRDPYLAANMLNLIGIEGAEGWGRETFSEGPGFGRYAGYFVSGCGYLIYGWAQATNDPDLFEKNAYLSMLGRHIISDYHTPLKAQPAGMVIGLLSASKDPEVKWWLSKNPLFAAKGDFLLLRYLWRNTVAPVAPTQKLTEASGCVVYDADPVDPNSFWFKAPLTRMRFGRYASPPEGRWECGIGKVGLVRNFSSVAGYQLGYINGWFCTKSPDQTGILLDPPAGEGEFQPYWWGPRPFMPEEVVTKPIYIRRTLAQYPTPKLDTDGHLRMTINLPEATSGMPSTIWGKVKSVVTTYDVDPAAKTIVIEQTANIFPANIGYHFSWRFNPTHKSVVTADGFSFGDGINTITVKLEPLDGTTLTRKVWPGKDVAKRLPEMLSYTPDVRKDEHKIRITIKCQ